MPTRVGVLGSHGETAEIGDRRDLLAEPLEATRLRELLRVGSRKLFERLSRRVGEITGQEHADATAALLRALEDQIEGGVFHLRRGVELLQSPLGARRKRLPERLREDRALLLDLG